MRILNDSNFISANAIIIKGSFKFVISVKILVVMLLAIKVFFTIRLTFSLVMPLMKVLVSASVPELVLLTVIIVSLRVIPIEISLWVRFIVFTPLVEILISLIVILLLS